MTEKTVQKYKSFTIQKNGLFLFDGRKIGFYADGEPNLGHLLCVGETWTDNGHFGNGSADFDIVANCPDQENAHLVTTALYAWVTEEPK